AAVASRNQRRGEGMRLRVRRIVAAHEDQGSGNGPALHGGLGFFAPAVLVFGEKPDIRTVHASFEFVPVKIARELLALLFELQLEIERGSVKVGGDGPAAAERPSGRRGFLRLLRVCRVAVA